MKQELITDYDTYSKRQETPVFHKIKFDSTSIYLTKSHFYENGIPNTGKNDNGFYRLFSWADIRAKAFLGFELGQESPALGRANIIGSFTPQEDDLKDVKYMSDSGKAYFKSALSEINGITLANDEVIKIDAKNFMKMKEIIPTGAQGKAIYGQGNYIIDGPAGTGKSTTVLQKIKLLQLQENIASEEIKVVVKHSKVVPRFEELLKTIDIDDISISSSESLIESLYGEKFTVTENRVKELNHLANETYELFCTVFDIPKLLSFAYEKDEEQVINLLSLAGNSSIFTRATEKFLDKADSIRKKKTSNDKELTQRNKKLRSEVAEKKEKLVQVFLNKKKRSLKNKLIESIGFNTNTDELSLAEETKINDQVNSYRKSEMEAISKLRARLEEDVTKQKSILDSYFKELSETFIQETSLTLEGIESVILTRYFNKLFSKKDNYHTVIIDEAQDVPRLHIELIRLCSTNTILAGDESQTENDKGLGLWHNLLISKPFESDDEINIYNLRHNFRQTFELGSVSYNYRQLILDREIEDIKSDYFDDQVGFNKPKIEFISDENSYLELIKHRINFINSAFSEPFPLVVFYENKPSLEKLSGILDKGGISYEVDNNLSPNCKVLFVSVWDIAGREFPVVLAPLTTNTESNTVYIMLSRAKFDLTFFIGLNKPVENKVKKLLDEGLIES
mgnify:CR=1 FL=1